MGPSSIFLSPGLRRRRYTTGGDALRSKFSQIVLILERSVLFGRKRDSTRKRRSCHQSSISGAGEEIHIESKSIKPTVDGFQIPNSRWSGYLSAWTVSFNIPAVSFTPAGSTIYF